MSTIALIGALAGDAHTLVIAGLDVVELKVTEQTNGIDAEGRTWVDDEPLVWLVYARSNTALLARLKDRQPVRVDGRIRNLWGRTVIDDAVLSLPFPEVARQEARPF